MSGVHLMKNLATTYSKVVAKFSISNLANTFSYLLRKAFSVLTGNYRRFFNRSSHKSLYVVNYILFSIIEMKSCNFFPT